MRKKHRRAMRTPAAIRMRHAGEAVAAISRELGVAESTVLDWVRDVTR